MIEKNTVQNVVNEWLAGKDYFGFIRQTRPCAILIETVFIDSEKDLDKIKTEEGCKKCGIAIGKALEKALDLKEESR